MGRIETNRILAIGLLVVVVLYVWVLSSKALCNDDYMALYTTWKMSLGDIPGVDFNVDSYTVLFDLLAPLWNLFGERIEAVYLFRFLLLLALAGVAVQIWLLLKRFVGRTGSLATVLLLFIAAPMYSRGLDLRPDIFILLLWLQTLILLSREDAREARSMLLVGLMLGGAFLLKFKSLVIGLPISIHFLHAGYRGTSIRSLVRSAAVLGAGFLLAILLYGVFFGMSELARLMDTSLNLMGLAVGGGIESSGSELSQLKQYLVLDLYYWILFLCGLAVATRRFHSYPASAKEMLISVFSLLACSLAMNPHYHAYNLITLYPLMAIFVALCVQWIIQKLRGLSAPKACLYLAAMSLLLALPAHRLAIYPLRRPMDHQLELHRFIQENTTPDQAVFAFEGIGLFRPSTYHWRTSYIMLGQYKGGGYNVWQEIKEARPVLTVLSYRVPFWLLEDDWRQLRSHYVTIAPNIMTLGFETDSSVDGRLLKDGLYEVTNSHGLKSVLDGREVEDRSIHRLAAGVHTLKSQGGRATLRWHFNDKALDRLKGNNPDQFGYLLTPIY